MGDTRSCRTEVQAADPEDVSSFYHIEEDDRSQATWRRCFVEENETFILGGRVGRTLTPPIED